MHKQIEKHRKTAPNNSLRTEMGWHSNSHPSLKGGYGNYWSDTGSDSSWM